MTNSMASSFPSKPHADVWNIIGLEEGFCAHTVSAVFGDVHHDLGWGKGVEVGHIFHFQSMDVSINKILP